ncbi:MAG: hypothetical protein R3F49_08355 [Planctomycetota bacterium]
MLRHSITLALFAATVSSATAQILPIAEELFDYNPRPMDLHTLGGGVGFSNNWYVQNNSDQQVVDNTLVTPTFGLADPGTGFLQQTVNNGACYRVVDANIHPDVTDAPNGVQVFGSDGATIWISYTAVRYTGPTATTEHYGGLRLFEQGCCEQLFLGSPWMTGGWGIDDEGPNGAPATTVPGSDNLVETQLVYRIDHMPGDERLRMWLNPVVPYPNTPADLDVMVHNFRWQEVSFQSGGNEGALFYFDNLKIEKGIPSNPGMNYCGPAAANSTGNAGRILAIGSDVASLNLLTLRAENLPLSSFGFFLTSATQGLVANPGGSQGTLCLGGAIGRYVGAGQIKNSGATGSFELPLNLTQTPTPNGLIAILAGDTRSFQAWHRDSIGGVATSNFSDGLVITFQ